MKTDRYYIRESTGFPIRFDKERSGNARQFTEILILDRDYCHRVVWSSLWAVSTIQSTSMYSRLLPVLRIRAKFLLKELNRKV